MSANANAQTTNAEQDEEDPEGVVRDGVLELGLGDQDTYTRSVPSSNAGVVNPVTRYVSPSMSVSPLRR